MIATTEAIERWRKQRDETFRAAFAPRPRLSIDEWADRYRKLSDVNSQEAGPWRTSRVPYLREILRTLTMPDVRRVVIMKAAQVSYTEGVIGNVIGFHIHQRPRSMLVVQPSDGDAIDWAKDKLQNLIEATPVLRERVREPRAKDGSTIQKKVYTGGQLKVVGAVSPRGLARTSSPIVLVDEVDRIEASAGDEGDPLDIVFARSSTYWDRLEIIGSTPLDLETSRIVEAFGESDQRFYHVPCPDCGEYQVLKWGGPEKAHGIKFEYRLVGKRKQVIRGSSYYLCEHCASAIPEGAKYEMYDRGEWRARNPESDIVGFHISGLMSPFDKCRWDSLAQQFLDATGRPERLKVFVNTRLGEPWRDPDTAVDPESLEQRARLGRPANVVPRPAAVLTGAVDVQVDRLEFAIYGWAHEEESYLVAHHRIHGDPTQREVWANLEALRTRPYAREDGTQLRISLTCVDEGYLPTEVAKYVRGREQARGSLGSVIAVKGSNTRMRSLYKRMKNKNQAGIRPYTIDVFALKDLLFRRLRTTEAGPGYMHFYRRPTDPEQFAADPDLPNGADSEYFAQYGREEAVYETENGRRVKKYRAKGPNEAVDLYVYNLFALHRLGRPARSRMKQHADALVQAAQLPEDNVPDEGEQAEKKGPSGKRGRRRVKMRIRMR